MYTKKKIIFITGKPKSGKTTLVGEIIKEFQPQKKISGIITPEFRNEKFVREGFFIQDLNSGKREILASVRITSEQKVGKYYVDTKAIDKILDLFLESFEDSEICIIDELGAMELKSKKFQNVIKNILKFDKFFIIVLHRNLVEKYKSKGELFFLDRKNFDETKKRIVDIINCSV